MAPIETASDLVSFWRKCPTRRAPFVHPADATILRDLELFERRRWTFSRFVASERLYCDGDGFHLSLLPVPYAGNIKKADIFVLLLNPGFGPADYYAEGTSAVFRTRLRQTLRQRLTGVEYPFRPLDPRLAWTSGARWWWNKLGGVAREIAERHYGGNVRGAVRDLAKRLAALELVPYHSRNFSGGSLLLDKLASAQAAIGFARGELQERALEGEATIIVTRRADAWGLRKAGPQPPRSGGILIYQGGETRGASLGPNTRGGRAILHAFG